MKILVTALEPSANLYLKSLLPFFEKQNIQIAGIFDPALKEEFQNSNLELLESSKNFSVMGVFAILPKIKFAKQIMKILVSKIEEFDHIFVIDSPAFNIPLIKKIREKNKDLPISYFILPKVWAWKKKRAEVINELVTNKISIFPFEDKFFEKPLYFGNPLLEQIKEFKTELKAENRVISFLAGSRKQEIKNLMPVFRSLKERLKCSGRRFILVIPQHFSEQEIREIYSDISDFEIKRDTHSALLESDFSFICSGTATLEASIIGTPFILVYETSKLEYFIGRMFVKLEYVGLANIIFNYAELGKFHDEVLQENLTADNLINLMLRTNKKKFLENSEKIRELLKNPINKNSFESIAELF